MIKSLSIRGLGQDQPTPDLGPPRLFEFEPGTTGELYHQLIVMASQYYRLRQFRDQMQAARRIRSELWTRTQNEALNEHLRTLDSLILRGSKQLLSTVRSVRGFATGQLDDLERKLKLVRKVQSVGLDLAGLPKKGLRGLGAVVTSAVLITALIVAGSSILAITLSDTSLLNWNRGEIAEAQVFEQTAAARNAFIQKRLSEGADPATIGREVQQTFGTLKPPTHSVSGLSWLAGFLLGRHPLATAAGTALVVGGGYYAWRKRKEIASVAHRIRLAPRQGASSVAGYRRRLR